MNRHHITFFNAQLEQGISEAEDVAVQLFIADMFALAGVVAFPDDGGTIAVFLADGGQGSLPPDSACRPRTI
ncbi:hypothetical protein ACLB1Q_18780 [Escherichia coli]